MRMGLIGLGQMGRHHARILSQTPDVEFVGAVDPKGDRHRALMRGKLFDSVDELVDAGLDAAVVATPTGEHRRPALRLAEAGVPTLVEKPLAESVQSAMEIKKAFEKAGVLAAVGHVERFNSALQQMKERLDRGELGHVFSITAERIGPFADRVQDVGVVKDLATHDIDIVTWIGGDRFAEVSGQLAHKMGRPHEDLLLAVGRLQNGVVVSMNVNWLTPVKRREVWVLGEKGAYVADLLSGELRFHANGEVGESWEELAILRGVSEGDTVTYAFPKREPLAVEHDAFRTAVRDGRAQGIITVDEGVAILEVAEQIVEASSGDR